MNYGLYLSANGIMANSYRQDVIANNLANSETIGFKRDLTCFRARLTEAQEARNRANTNPLLEPMGGGMLAHPGAVDVTQGDLETTGNNLDIAIFGDGFLAVTDGKGPTRLTRDGRLAVDRAGNLVLANDPNRKVLGPDMKPIVLDGRESASVSIGQHGEITQAGQRVATLGLFETDQTQFKKLGGNLIATDVKKLRPAKGQIQSENVERSNVDPTNELSQLMDAQRQLEANANMIRYQDQTLGRLVNDVGKMT